MGQEPVAGDSDRGHGAVVNRAVVLPVVPMRGINWVALQRVSPGQVELVSLPGAVGAEQVRADLAARHDLVVGVDALQRLRSVYEPDGSLLEVWACRLSPAHGFSLADGQLTGTGTGRLEWMMAHPADGLVAYGKIQHLDSLAGWAVGGPLACQPAPSGTAARTARVQDVA